MSSKEEKFLIEESIKGNDRAFEILMKSYEKKVFGLAYNFSNSLEDAKDIFQETFIKVYKNLSSFRGESSLSTWIYRIAANVCLSKYRQKKSNFLFLRFDNFRDNDNKEEIQIADYNCRIESKYAREEIVEKIKNIANKLPPRQKMAFCLRFYEDLKLTEIAKIMDISEGAAKRYLHNSIKKIKAEIEKIGVKEFYD